MTAPLGGDDDGAADMPTATGEWPQTVRVSGREYHASPTMPMSEFTEMVQSMQNEADTVLTLADTLGLELDGDELGGDGTEDGQ